MGKARRGRPGLSTAKSYGSKAKYMGGAVADRFASVNDPGRSDWPDQPPDSRGATASSAPNPVAAVVPISDPAVVATEMIPMAYRTPATFAYGVDHDLVFAALMVPNRAVSFGVDATSVPSPFAATVYKPTRIKVTVAAAALPHQNRT